MELLLKYFPELTDRQTEQFATLGELYEEWNARINVVSRKDFDELYIRHVLHSLAIAKVCSFADGARIIDIGTGGGFPAIPLAIMFPKAHFTAVDSIGKKIRVVEEVARGAGLKNIEAVNVRAEDIPGRFDYAVSRAVAPAATLINWVWPKIECSRTSNKPAGSLPNGMLLLKGGDLTAELAETKLPYTYYNISDSFDEEFFDTKKVIYFQKVKCKK